MAPSINYCKRYRVEKEKPNIFRLRTAGFTPKAIHEMIFIKYEDSETYVDLALLNRIIREWTTEDSEGQWASLPRGHNQISNECSLTHVDSQGRLNLEYAVFHQNMSHQIPSAHESMHVDNVQYDSAFIARSDSLDGEALKGTGQMTIYDDNTMPGRFEPQTSPIFDIMKSNAQDPDINQLYSGWGPNDQRSMVHTPDGGNNFTSMLFSPTLSGIDPSLTQPQTFILSQQMDEATRHLGSNGLGMVDIMSRIQEAPMTDAPHPFGATLFQPKRVESPAQRDDILSDEVYHEAMDKNDE